MAQPTTRQLDNLIQVWARLTSSQLGRSGLFVLGAQHSSEGEDHDSHCERA